VNLGPCVCVSLSVCLCLCVSLTQRVSLCVFLCVFKRAIQHIKNILKANQIQRQTLREDLNGELQGSKKFQNKTGVNLLANLKKEILIFGKNMKVNSGKNTMHVYAQMVKMESMIKQKNQKNNQTFSLM